MRAARTLIALTALLLAGATVRPVAQTPAAPQDLFHDDVHAR